MKYIKLSEYAKNISVTYRTAWNHYKSGKIPGAIESNSGSILVPLLAEPKPVSQPRVCIYCRVSSSENKSNLETQAERLIDFSIKNGFQITKIIKEIGSGVNDHRKQLISILEDNSSWDILLVENKDRLTRFGFNYLDILIKSLNKNILVVNLAENQVHDLMDDMISIVYSFSARLYGLRRGKSKADKIKEIIQNDKNI